jgi:2-polyprenyl-3-methyl-5-hydroxy-6-metoxy-1,4-benzoquinol methylase
MNNSKRSYEKELLDLGPDFYSQQEYDDCLKQLGRIGRFLGGNRAAFKIFKKLSKPQSILDVGCGGGEFAIQLAKKFPGTQITGIDISQQAIEVANKHLQKASLTNIKFIASSSPQLSFNLNSFDIVTSTLVCHHLNDDQLIDFLKKSYQIAKQGIIINDLHRHWLASSCFGIIANLFFRNRLILHDGLLSIKRAFKKQDWIDYLNAAEIPLKDCSISWHWAFRWILYIDTSTKHKS